MYLTTAFTFCHFARKMTNTTLPPLSSCKNLPWIMINLHLPLEDLRQRLYELFFFTFNPKCQLFFTPPLKTYLIIIYPSPRGISPQPRRGGGGERRRLQCFVDLVTSRTFDFVKKRKKYSSLWLSLAITSVYSFQVGTCRSITSVFIIHVVETCFKCGQRVWKVVNISTLSAARGLRSNRSIFQFHAKNCLMSRRIEMKLVLEWKRSIKMTNIFRIFYCSIEFSLLLDVKM